MECIDSLYQPDDFPEKDQNSRAAAQGIAETAAHVSPTHVSSVSDIPTHNRICTAPFE